MTLDAVVVGSGPNGLSAAIELARNGLSVTVYEGNDTIGGGCRSAALTLPGFIHDLCSAIHPLGAASPFFHSLNLGIDWIFPPIALAHPFDDQTTAVLSSLEITGKSLGIDSKAYIDLMSPFVKNWHKIEK